MRSNPNIPQSNSKIVPPSIPAPRKEEDVVTKSLEVMQTFDTETGLVNFVVSLKDLDKVIATMNKQAQRLDKENARLRAEVERLRPMSFATAVPSEHYEKVVKAGDAMRDDLETLTKSSWFNKCESVKEWNALKGGQTE
jgi:regulator of replication initiation timing